MRLREENIGCYKDRYDPRRPFRCLLSVATWFSFPCYIHIVDVGISRISLSRLVDYPRSQKASIRNYRLTDNSYIRVYRIRSIARGLTTIYPFIAYVNFFMTKLALSITPNGTALCALSQTSARYHNNTCAIFRFLISKLMRG